MMRTLTPSKKYQMLFYPVFVLKVQVLNILSAEINQRLLFQDRNLYRHLVPRLQ